VQIIEKFKLLLVLIWVFLISLLLGACVSEASQKQLLSSAELVMECKSEKRPKRVDGTYFETLTEYIKHREEGGRIDLPFYKKQDDGRYRLIRGRAESKLEPVYFTQEELETKYGFDC